MTFRGNQRLRSGWEQPRVQGTKSGDKWRYYKSARKGEMARGRWRIEKGEGRAARSTDWQIWIWLLNLQNTHRIRVPRHCARHSATRHLGDRKSQMPQPRRRAAGVVTLVTARGRSCWLGSSKSMKWQKVIRGEYSWYVSVDF